MRVLHAATLAAAALVLASVASAQGLGDVAAKEQQKRKAEPTKPAKVYTESDIGPSMTPAPSTPTLPTDAEQAASAASAEGQPAAEGGTPAAEQAQAEEEARAQAEADWRKRLDQARKEEAVYKDVIDKVQQDLNDISGGLYNPGRTSKMAFLDESKQKLAEVQGRIATLEEEGRRNRYR
jgi:hypothetical protein